MPTDPGKFIRRFGGVHDKANAHRYGVQAHGRGAMPPPIPPGGVRPGMDYGTAPTMNSYGRNSSGFPSDASDPTPNTDAQNMGS